jgi:Tol biopolymer transport system component
MTRRALLGIVCLAASFAAAAPADALVGGRNGRIAFSSGREGLNDNLAQLYLVNPRTPTPLGNPFSIPGTQNRHPSWSPDRTKVVFAAGTPGTAATEEFDLFVKDLETGTVTPLDFTKLGDGLSSDHPAWSPDGTRIAYDHQPANNSEDRNIKVKTLGSSAPAVDLTGGAIVEVEPAWSPDSQTIYYARESFGPPVNVNIVKRPAAGGEEAGVRSDPLVDEYQPAISADGTKFCYTRQTTHLVPATANIMVADFPSMDGAQTHSPDNTRADTNCAFSPDGTKIAYTNGTSSQGRLVMQRVGDVVSQPVELADDIGSNNFDGDADWAPDGSPDCPDTTVTTAVNTPVTIQLECTDTGPLYERTDPSGFVANGGAPRNGTTSDDQPLETPSTVLYTPNPGFAGSDRIVYTSFDAFGFGTDSGTVTINVTAPGADGPGGDGPVGGGGPGVRPECAGRTATIVGTAGRDLLRGTRRADVITALGGSDRVAGLRGNDLVCGGGGRDLLLGGRGRDRLVGGRGRDKCFGGPGRDLVGCP